MKLIFRNNNWKAVIRTKRTNTAYLQHYHISLIPLRVAQVKRKELRYFLALRCTLSHALYYT